MGISRRHFLRANGAALALPFLHSIGAAADDPSGSTPSGTRPSRKTVVVYLPNGLVRRCFFPGEEQASLPEFMGSFNADSTKDEVRRSNEPGVYPLQLTSTMQPLADHADDITLVTGLDRTFKNGQDVHAQGASAYLTSLSPEQAAERNERYPNGRSLDQLIGDHVGHSTVQNTLEVSCNGFQQGKEDIYFDNISWYGPGRIAPSIKDPGKLYERLFVGGGLREHLGDVTDLVLADARDLRAKVGREDKRVLDEFTGMIRDVEIRLDKMQQVLATADVRVPRDEILPRGEYIRLQADMMLLALQMGITNVATFMIGPERWEAPMLYEGVFDKPVNHHTLTHNQKGDGWRELQKIDLFHMQQFAYLLARMKEFKESDGTSLLENSIVTCGAGLGDGATHQYFDLPMILAGTMQGDVAQGRFLQVKSGTLNSNLWLSIAQLMGLEIDYYADSSGPLSEILA